MDDPVVRVESYRTLYILFYKRVSVRHWTLTLKQLLFHQRHNGNALRSQSLRIIPIFKILIKILVILVTLCRCAVWFGDRLIFGLVGATMSSARLYGQYGHVLYGRFAKQVSWLLIPVLLVVLSLEILTKWWLHLVQRARVYWMPQLLQSDFWNLNIW